MDHQLKEKLNQVNEEFDEKFSAILKSMNDLHDSYIPSSDELLDAFNSKIPLKADLTPRNQRMDRLEAITIFAEVCMRGMKDDFDLGDVCIHMIKEHVGKAWFTKGNGRA